VYLLVCSYLRIETAMRKFPTPGFYAFNAAKCVPGATKKEPDNTSVIYVTGTTTGNKYRDPENHSNKWNDLTWTCVPTIKRMEEERDFYPENPTSLPL
jgi:hypothetical protein